MTDLLQKESCNGIMPNGASRKTKPPKYLSFKIDVERLRACCNRQRKTGFLRIAVLFRYRNWLDALRGDLTFFHLLGEFYLRRGHRGRRGHGDLYQTQGNLGRRVAALGIDDRSARLVIGSVESHVAGRHGRALVAHVPRHRRGRFTASRNRQRE